MMPWTGSGEDISPDGTRRANGIRIAGAGLILVFISGIGEVFWWNAIWPFLVLTGFTLTAAGLLLAGVEASRFKPPT